MVPRSRAWLLPVLACVAATLSPAQSQALAQTGPDQLRLDAPARGQRALDALGNDVATAAAANGMTGHELRELVLGDDTAWLDKTGRVFFKDPLPSGTVDAGELEPPAQAVADPFALHSKPGSQHVIFLDFDGASVSGTAWNQSYPLPAGTHPAWTLDADATTFSTTERDAIASIWARVSEDYAPFDVDVTTQDPGAAAIDRTSSTDPTYGTRVLITPSVAASTAICNNRCGGVAYLDVFDVPGSNHAYYQPAWVFPQSLANSTKSIAEAATHEAGHNFGLDHDATAVASYYSGHAMWAPIMGSGYSRPVVQWSKGEYAGATTTEDDLAMIAANGAPLRPDEAGGTTATAATQLPIGGAYITTRTDQDLYALGTCSGSVSLAAAPASTSPNLDIQLALVGADGTVVASANPASAMSSQDVATGMGATLTQSVPAGTYFVRVDGVGNGTVLTGYSDYASIGAYTLSASGACTTVTANPAVAPTAPTSLTTVVRAGALEADIDWAPPTSDGGSPVTGYRLTVDGDVVADTSASQTAATLTGLAAGETYAVAVRARNSVGLGAPAQTSFSVPAAASVPPVAATAPSAPRIGAAASGARGGRSTATAKWSPPLDDGGSAVTGYQVRAQRLNSSGAVVKTITSAWLAPSARALKLRLVKGRYRFVVVARNRIGASAWSAPSRIVRAR